MNAVLLLAAGRSVHFGSDKRLAELADGRSLLETCLENILNSNLGLLCVLRQDDLQLAEQLSEQYPKAHFLRCPESALGIGHSLAFGVEQAANLRFSAIALAMADMPWIKSASYSAVTQRITPDRIMVPRYREHPGQPVGYGSRFFAELRSCRGDQSIDNIWKSHMDRVEFLELDDEGILADVSYPRDMAR